MKIFVPILGLILTGCMTFNTHISDAENTWVNKTESFLGIFTISSPMYCQADKFSNNISAPICYEAKMGNSAGRVSSRPFIKKSDNIEEKSILLKKGENE